MYASSEELHQLTSSFCCISCIRLPMGFCTVCFAYSAHTCIDFQRVPLPRAVAGFFQHARNCIGWDDIALYPRGCTFHLLGIPVCLDVGWCESDFHFALLILSISFTFFKAVWHRFYWSLYFYSFCPWEYLLTADFTSVFYCIWLFNYSCCMTWSLVLLMNCSFSLLSFPLYFKSIALTLSLHIYSSVVSSHFSY